MIVSNAKSYTYIFISGFTEIEISDVAQLQEDKQIN